MNDTIHDLQNLQRYATNPQNLTRETGSKSWLFEGIDASGSVRVALGSDGLPETVSVDDDWTQRLRAHQFGRAVLEAAQAASDQRTARWSEAIADEGWQAEVQRLEERIAADMAERPPEPPSPRSAHGTREVRPRDASTILREVRTLVDDIDELAQAPAVQGGGSAAFGRLQVTLSQLGMVSCTADPGWAQYKSPEELSEAFAAALASAREDLARAVADTPAGRLQQLLDEVLARFDEPDASG
jgi:hypothetical protein